VPWYESQLSRTGQSCTGDWRRDRQRRAGSVDENARTVAEHLKAAGNLHTAFNWYMRGVAYAPDLAGARQLAHARDVATRLPTPTRPHRDGSRLDHCAPALGCRRTMPTPDSTNCSELASAAVTRCRRHGAAGYLRMVFTTNPRSVRAGFRTRRPARVDRDPELTVGLLYSAIAAKLTRRHHRSRKTAQRVIDLADGTSRWQLHPRRSIGWRNHAEGVARSYLGDRGWTEDVEQDDDGAAFNRPCVVMLFSNSAD